MLVAVCTLRSAIALEHTLLSSYSSDLDVVTWSVESLGGESELEGRQYRLCPVLVPASALEGVLVGVSVTCVEGELVAL